MQGVSCPLGGGEAEQSEDGGKVSNESALQRGRRGTLEQKMTGRVQHTSVSSLHLSLLSGCCATHRIVTSALGDQDHADIWQSYEELASA